MKVFGCSIGDMNVIVTNVVTLAEAVRSYSYEGFSDALIFVSECTEADLYAEVTAELLHIGLDDEGIEFELGFLDEMIKLNCIRCDFEDMDYDED